MIKELFFLFKKDTKLPLDLIKIILKYIKCSIPNCNNLAQGLQERSQYLFGFGSGYREPWVETLCIHCNECNWVPEVYFISAPGSRAII